MSPGLTVPGTDASLLLSPSAFQQTVNKSPTVAAPVVPPGPAEPPSASGGPVEPLAVPCSKTQLQETLMHLIKVHQRHKTKGILVGEVQAKAVDSNQSCTVYCERIIHS